MKLLRIKVEQLRQFRQPFELSGLEPGLNLFTGPNEAGKSTVVRAIRAAFFERHRSSSVEDLLPWGEPSATPTVEIDFSIHDRVFSLKKCFLKKGRCELHKQDGDLDGEAAEQYLAELLGFEFPGRGSSKPEHWGIPGLLWIEQGTGQDIAESVGNATDHLRKALDRSVSDVSSGMGDEVINKVRKQRDALLTNNGRPRAAYAEAIDAHSTLLVSLEEMDRRIDQYQRQVDQLGNLLAEDAADNLAKPWVSFRHEQAEAEGRLASIVELKNLLDADLTSLEKIREKQTLIEDQLQSFEAQRVELQTRESTLVKIQENVSALQAANDRLQEKSNLAEAAYRLATDALALARQEALRDDLSAAAIQSKDRIASITETLNSATSEQSNIDGLRKIARDTLIAEEDMKLLRAQQSSLNEIQIRREVAATRVRYLLLPGVKVSNGPDALTGTGEMLVTQAIKLKIDGVGDFEIAPGGADLIDLAREAETILGLQTALSNRLGVSSLPEAELRFASYQQATTDAKHAERALSLLAPHGVDALRSELDEHISKLKSAQARLDQLTPKPESSVLTLLQAQVAHESAIELRDEASRDASKALIDLVAARERAESALYERDALATLLGSGDRQVRQMEINQSALNTRAEREALQARASARKAEVDTARPDILAQDAERLKRSADQCERQFRERQTNITVLRSRLEEAGANGLEEARSEISVSADAAGRRLNEIKRRAEALDLLLSLLDAKRSELTKKIQAPLQKHIHRYLQLLFPRATLDIDDDLVPGMLTRMDHIGSQVGHINEMSYGAREQMGVISRLAYADLLKEAGRPTLIILDDALVHTDAQRLEQMKRVIFDASKRHQVLVFSCHPAAWKNVGANPVAIGRTAQV